MAEQWQYPQQSDRQDLPSFIRALNVAFARLTQLVRLMVTTATTATGTANRVAKWTGAGVLGDSSITDTGTTVTSTATGLAVGTNPAQSGTLRVPNSSPAVAARNAANSGDITLIHLTSGDLVALRGSWYINGSSTLYPSADNAQDLGSVAARLKDLHAAGKLTLGGEAEIGGALNHDGTTVGFYGVTPVTRPSALTQTYSTADRTLSAYTADNEGSAYTGVDNLQAGSVYATVADLNALRVAYENLRAFTEDLAQHHNALVDDMQANGLEQ